MIYKDIDTVSLEEGEPQLRSCWECNPSHEYLKERGHLHLCVMGCGRYYSLGDYLDGGDIESFMKKHNIKIGESTITFV